MKRYAVSSNQSEPSLSEDLIDIALMEEAKKVKGKPIPAEEYFERRRRIEKDS